MRKLIKEFRRYILAGGVAFIIDFGTLFFLTDYLGWHYLVSATGAFSLGLLTNYACSIRYVFNHRSRSDRRLEFFIFAAVGVGGLLINNLCLFGLTEKLGLHYLVSKIIAAAIVLVFNFSLRRALLFTPLKAAALSPIPPGSDQ
jgi:putative flippase GtrA